MNTDEREPDASEFLNRLPNEAFIVRGGRNLPDDVVAGVSLHWWGVAGVSVHCATGVPIDELAVGIPHGQIGVTTVGKVREMGGDVIRTPGRSPYHATLTGLTPEQVHNLFTPTIPNPVGRRSRARR